MKKLVKSLGIIIALAMITSCNSSIKEKEQAQTEIACDEALNQRMDSLLGRSVPTKVVTATREDSIFRSQPHWSQLEPGEFNYPQHFGDTMGYILANVDGKGLDALFVILDYRDTVSRSVPLQFHLANGQYDIPNLYLESWWPHLCAQDINEDGIDEICCIEWACESNWGPDFMVFGLHEGRWCKTFSRDLRIYGGNGDLDACSIVRGFEDGKIIAIENEFVDSGLVTNQVKLKFEYHSCPEANKPHRNSK